MKKVKPKKIRRSSAPKARKSETTPRHYQYAAPVFLAKLYKKLDSGTAVGELVGCSGATVTTALREGRVTKPVEMAAQGVWERQYEKGDGRVLAAVRLSPEALKIISPWLAQNDAEFKVFG